MPIQKTNLKRVWKIAPVDEKNFSSLLKMMADYQRFYGVEEPDEEKNQEFFSQFICHQEKGRQFLCFNERGEAIGFSTLYYVPPNRTLILTLPADHDRTGIAGFFPSMLGLGWGRTQLNESRIRDTTILVFAETFPAHSDALEIREHGAPACRCPESHS